MLRKRNAVERGRVFFFFFSPAFSPQYQDPRFLQFCRACHAVRRFRPSLTVSALRTAFTVIAAQDSKPLSYDEVAAATGLKYDLAAHQIGKLAEGRIGHPGAMLLRRVTRESGRQKVVTPSRLGLATGRCFVPAAEISALVANRQNCSAHLSAFLRESTLPGLQFLHVALPGLSMGTLSVLLYIATHQIHFGFEGTPAKQIAKDLGVSNLGRHLSLLTNGKDDWHTRRLVVPTPHKKKSRLILAELTDDGYRLISQLAGILIGEPAMVPRRAKTSKLEELDSPAAIVDLGKDDFIDIEWDADKPKR